MNLKSDFSCFMCSMDVRKSHFSYNECYFTLDHLSLLYIFNKLKLVKLMPFSVLLALAFDKLRGCVYYKNHYYRYMICIV